MGCWTVTPTSPAHSIRPPPGNHRRRFSSASMIDRYVVYRSVLAAPCRGGLPAPAPSDPPVKTASALDQTCVTPQCGHRTEFPVNTER